ncbi:accessory Sec system translocase SecA2 [Sporosalibacterium faouarense]|uniref:accessory Sec system translocase SecA2 n=1 Tax=Sporosalibacterium faouarense TaxID=516123 RepID=UPI00192B085A|nr:accessory Sec system translocase SecA2 [Sporosalibacterium faouarense]
MLKQLSNLYKKVEKLYSPIEYDLNSYYEILGEINKMNFRALDDSEIKDISKKLISIVKQGESIENILIKAFAIVREASFRVIGEFPFDVQVIAAIAMNQGKVVEMKTGEGKTLAAVMTAYLNALEGKGVHILTFNDYLSKRDALWMGPIFEFLGLTVGYVEESMDVKERQKAYSCDITYVTAKEAGFDYLRDFLCTQRTNLVHRKFNFAIIDEADSILIDEARIPLVIAGEVEQDSQKLLYLAEVVRKLEETKHYEVDENLMNLSLTDEGLEYVEEVIDCENLYDNENLWLLARVNSALHAEVLLEKDKDYIVRDNKVEIVDEFTGRIAKNRHWPDNLQRAVEAKEGIASKKSGKILGSIPLQYFLNLYPKVSGMTGTAVSDAKEFKEFYSLDVVSIPTNKPCQRIDHMDSLFINKGDKSKALIAEINKIHKTGQPILIGTGSVEESENLFKELLKIEIECEVLNARNDEMEAEIIAKAGEFGAVTVSTNMAGRGVDIKLGGDKEQNYNEVVKLGGLYVIGTNRHESLRIDNQLRGRAGRQGDPGESRFFVSLEDELFKRYDITKLVPNSKISNCKNGKIEDRLVNKEVDRIQRIVQGYNSDTRKQLWKYSYIIEQQRRIIHNMRGNILLNDSSIGMLSKLASDRYSSDVKKYGVQLVNKVERQLALYFINKHWSDYLEYMEYIRESIHLVIVGRKNPLDEFHRIAIEAFDDMRNRIEEDVISTFDTIKITDNGVDMESEGLNAPSSTWTYLIDDNPNQFSHLGFIVKAMEPIAKGTLFTLNSIYRKVFRK